jgi:hypothetical protein
MHRKQVQGENWEKRNEIDFVQNPVRNCILQKQFEFSAKNLIIFSLECSILLRIIILK